MYVYIYIYMYVYIYIYIYIYAGLRIVDVDLGAVLQEHVAHRQRGSLAHVARVLGGNECAQSPY